WAAWTTLSHASPVDVLSSDYHLWGNTFLDQPFQQPPAPLIAQAYDRFASTPVSGAAHVSSDDAVLTASSDSSTGEFFTQVNGDSGYGGFAEAHAAASWTFQPTMDNVSLAIHANDLVGFGWGSAFVTDLTTHFPVYNGSFTVNGCCIET